MTLKDIGEFGFIDRFSQNFTSGDSNIQKGIGDDCAIFPAELEKENSNYYLFTTDLLVENIHFLKNKIFPEELGYKSLAVSLSDIAAMGGKPKFSFLSIGLPSDISIDYLDRFMDGYRKLSEKYNVILMGGDTTGSKSGIVINVGVVGIQKNNQIKKRSDAQTGDLICVTGNLGDSAAGLKILLEDKPLEGNNNKAKYQDNLRNRILIGRHHNPEPRVKEGLFLSKYKDIHAMMDISDGISSDLHHILRNSKKKAIIDLYKLPLSAELKSASKEYVWNIYDLAIGGGEDYELLFTMSPDNFDEINTKYKENFKTEIIPIGKILDGDHSDKEDSINDIEYLPEIESRKLTIKGFDHFKNK